MCYHIIINIVYTIDTFYFRDSWSQMFKPKEVLLKSLNCIQSAVQEVVGKYGNANLYETQFRSFFETVIINNFFIQIYLPVL